MIEVRFHHFPGVPIEGRQKHRDLKFQRKTINWDSCGCVQEVLDMMIDFKGVFNRLEFRHGLEILLTAI